MSKTVLREKRSPSADSMQMENVGTAPNVDPCIQGSAQNTDKVEIPQSTQMDAMANVANIIRMDADISHVYCTMSKSSKDAESKMLCSYIIEET